MPEVAPTVSRRRFELAGQTHTLKAEDCDGLIGPHFPQDISSLSSHH